MMDDIYRETVEKIVEYDGVCKHSNKVSISCSDCPLIKDVLLCSIPYKNKKRAVRYLRLYDEQIKGFDEINSALNCVYWAATDLRKFMKGCFYDDTWKSKMASTHNLDKEIEDIFKLLRAEEALIQEVVR